MESENIKSIFSYDDVAFIRDNDYLKLLSIKCIRPLVESVATRGHALGIDTWRLNDIMDVLYLGLYAPVVSKIQIVLRGEYKIFYWPKLHMTQFELINMQFLPPAVVERFKEVWAFISGALRNTWSRMGPLRITLHDQYESNHVDIHNSFHFDYRGPNSYDPFSPLNGQISIPESPFIVIEADRLQKKISIKKNPSCQAIVKKAHNLFISMEASQFIMTVHNARCVGGAILHDNAARRFGGSPLFDTHLVRSIMQFLHM